MHRIEGENVDTSEGKNLFRTEAPYTVETPEWANSVQEEIMNIIDEAGLETLFSDNDTRDQLLTALQQIFKEHVENKKEIDDEDYTLQDNDVYDLFTFDNLTADRDFNLATLADYNQKSFYIVNLDGSYDVIINPEGAENINDWNYQFNITEKYGIVKVIKLSDRWLVLPLNDACIYYVESETADTGLTLDGTWDDVTGMILLNGVYGKGYLSARGIQSAEDTSFPKYINLFFGIGKTSGNNAPDIPKAYDFYNRVEVTPDNLYRFMVTKRIVNVEYESDGSTVYMKAKVETDESPMTAHEIYGATNAPMYIKFCRRY